MDSRECLCGIFEYYTVYACVFKRQLTWLVDVSEKRESMQRHMSHVVPDQV